MTVVSILLTSFALQAKKAPDTRVVEVKPAGLSVSVPKSWGSNPKDSNLSASLKIPISGSKNFGRMDIGYVLDESKDVDGFQEAVKNVLTVGGNTIERQWKVDVMDATLALTRFSKNGSTTVRGVMFRPTKAKFVISVSSQTADFDKVEPFVLSTLETLKEIKVVQPKQPVVATEKTIQIPRATPIPTVKLTVSHPVAVTGHNLYFHFPTGTRVNKISESSVSATIPGTNLTVLYTAFGSDANPSQTYQTKAADSVKLYSGAVVRVDKDYSNNSDKQVRDMVWRTGSSVKNSSPLMTCDCILTQPNPYFAHAYFASTDAAQFKKDQKMVTDFLLAVNLTDKP